MRHARFALVLVAGLAIGACKNKGEAGQGTGTGTASPATMADAAVAAAAASCELAGNYRLRFRTNGADGWFLRFTVTPDGKGSFTEPQVMLGVDPAPLASVTPDVAACKLNVRGTGRNAGDIGLALTVDRATGAVTGQMTRTEGAADELNVPVTGWRTAGEPTMPDACFVPGTYKLQISPEATWRNPDDDRSCKGQQPPDVVVRIEAWGNELSIDQVDTRPPYDQTWGEEKATRNGCEVSLELQAEQIELRADLTFVGGQVIGLVKHAKIQVIEETETSEDIWNCTTENTTLALTTL